MTTSSEPRGGGPFREGGGTPCPRCGLPMLAASAKKPFHCSATCGSWYSPTALDELIDPADLSSHTVNWWKHGVALPCPKCHTQMAITVIHRRLGLADTATVERCAAHGIWVSSECRGSFKRVFSHATDEQASMSPLPLTGAASDMSQRVANLERVVADLTEQLKQLSERTPR